MLDDPMLVPRAAEIVREQRVNAEWAVQQRLRGVQRRLRRGRGSVPARAEGRRRGPGRPAAHEPAPRRRDAARPAARARRGLGADRRRADAVGGGAAGLDASVHGFATDAGSRTYHTAILARSLEVPAVVGLHDASRRDSARAAVVIDGTTSEVIVDPRRGDADARVAPAATTARRRRPGDTSARTGVDRRRRPHPARGEHRIARRPAAARYAGAEGIGLYRSEFLLSGARRLPTADEDEQYAIYRSMLEGMAPGPVTIRTFDVDEDQLACGRWPTLGADAERARPPGLRGLRLSLARPELFRTQLRALLRAAPMARCASCSRSCPASRRCARRGGWWPRRRPT